MNELLLIRMLRSLSLRRISNIIKTSLSFILSALLEKPVVWGLPAVLTIEPTNLCNLRCPLCTTGAGEMERAGGRMTLETFQTLMQKIGDDIFFLLVYHQGEPYLNHHFFDFVKIAKEKKIYVTTSTNGHYFTPKNVEKTIDCGLDSMIVSIDGVTQESYATYRVGGKLQKVIDGTRLLMQEKKRRGSRTPNVALQFLVMKHNEHEIPAMRKLGKELGVDRILVKNIEVRSLEEARHWLPANETFRRYNMDGDDFIVKGAEKKSCTRPWLSTLVNWNGTLVPCCFDKNGQHAMGNTNSSDSISELWQGSSFKEFRRQLLADRKQIDICRNCNQGFGSFLPQRSWKKNKSLQVLEPVKSPLNKGGEGIV